MQGLSIVVAGHPGTRSCLMLDRPSRPVCAGLGGFQPSVASRRHGIRPVRVPGRPATILKDPGLGTRTLERVSRS